MNGSVAVACLVVWLLGAAVRIANVGNVQTRTPDERVYTSQAIVLLNRGVEGSRALVADYIRDPEQQLYPAPTRIGYTAILAAAMQLAGARTESVGAWLSCVASIAALGLTMLIGYQFFDPWVGLTAGVFLSVFPPELVLARRTWEEALINCLALVMIYCAFRIRQNPNPRWPYVTLGVVGGWLLLIKEYAPMIFGLCVLWAGIALVARRRWNAVVWLAGSALFGFFAAAGAMTVAAGGLDVWLRAFKINLAANSANAYALQYCTGPGYLLAAGFWILSPLVTLLAAAALVLAFARRGSLFAERRDSIGLAAFTILFAALPVVLPHWMNLRYVSVLNAPLCLLGALAACQVWQWTRAFVREREKLPALALACFVLLLGAVTDYRSFRERYVRAQTADLAIRMVVNFPQ
jgi:Dolichyl-phosphate-mannose-protein mannosyltransferase